MNKVKTVKIKNEDGSISEESYSIAADAINIDMANSKNVQETIGTIDVDTDGDIATQLKNKVNKNDIIDNLNSSDANKVLSAKQGKMLEDAVTAANLDIKKKVYYFNTVADMKVANLQVGDVCQTLGYYEANDGGEGLYRIVDDDTLVDDGGSVHNLTNGLKAVLIVTNGTVNVKQFGAYGDGVHNDTTSFINAISIANGKKIKLYLSNKIYKITAFSITLTNDLAIEGNNTIIENSGEVVILGTNKTNNITVKNITFKNGIATSLQNFDNINLENYNTINQNKFGILVSNSNYFNINNSKFVENGKNLTFSEISNKGMAILCSSCGFVNVNNCYFEKNWGQGTLRISGCDNIDVDNNTFINNMFRAVELPMVSGNLYNYNGKISNNYIYGCGYQNINPDNDERTNGIFANGADGYVDVIDNIIINSQENGIEGYFRHIKNNLIDGTGVGTKPTTACAGASVRCKTFENNTIKNTLSSGISAGGDGTNRSNCSICNNTFENIGEKAAIYYGFVGTPISIENLTIMNNVCNNRPVIGWANNITGLALSNIKLLNNKGIGLLDVSLHSVLPIQNYEVLDEKIIITKNNRLINWNTGKPTEWDITANGAVTESSDGNEKICKIDGIAYNTYISQSFELSKNLNDTLYEIKIKFKGTDIQFYLENIAFDDTRTTVYQNNYTSSDSSNFIEYKIVFRPYETITTGKLNLKVRTSATSIQYKEITLSKFYQ